MYQELPPLLLAQAEKQQRKISPRSQRAVRRLERAR